MKLVGAEPKGTWLTSDTHLDRVGLNDSQVLLGRLWVVFEFLDEFFFELFICTCAALELQKGNVELCFFDFDLFFCELEATWEITVGL